MAEHIADLAASFRRHVRAEGRSERTATVYGQAIRFHSAWLVAQGRTATLDELSRAGIRNWLSELADVLEPSTVRTRYKGLRRFCRWLVAEGELEVDPMVGLEVPHVVDRPVPVLSDDDLAALLKTCNGRTFNDRRDEAVIRLLLDCGLRVSELSGLDVADVDLNREVATVTGKGNKVRPIYLGARTIRAVDRYLRERRRHRLNHHDALLLSQRGRLSPDGIRDMLRVRGAAAGISDLHPHRSATLGRTTFCSLAVRSAI